jgi:hypothetical protein
MARLTGMDKELRILSEDGEWITLADDGGNHYRARKRATSLHQPHLTAVITDSPLTIKEIQSRLRAGETAEELAATTGTPIEKIERFAGPIIHERNHIISRALDTEIKRSRSGGVLGDVVVERLGARGVEATNLDWSAYRREDGVWTINLSYPTRDGHASAQWVLDLTRGTLAAEDDGARWISGDDRAPAEKVKAQLPVDFGSDREDFQTRPAREVVEAREIRDAPRLSVIREEVEPNSDASADGVTGRAKVPTWDEIMFGKKSDD